MLPFWSVLRPLAIIGLVAGTAAANPDSLVPSAGVEGAPMSLHIRLDYAYELDRSVLQREDTGSPGTDPLGGIPRHNDLAFHQYRHVLTPRAEVGIFRDTWLSLALPIVIGQARELELASGVDRAGSSTLQDGLLPSAGFDARDPSAPPPGDLVFRGVSRSGLDQIHAGLNFALMNQRRDDTKPTWKIGAELRFAVGRVMRFDARDPSSETGVSKGVHELRLWTSMDRQFSWTEGWFEVFWQTPIAVKDTSLFQDPGFGSTNSKLSQTGGVAFGIETYALDDKQTGNRISVDLGARIVGHFEGRDYSEMWEPFAYAGDSRGGGSLILDRDPTDPGFQSQSHPGISNIENYLETAGRMAVRASLGEHVRFAAIVDIAWKTDHVISFADAGIDLPTCGTSGGDCEDATNDVVNPGSREVNPLHAPLIDLVGHRYHSIDNLGVVIGLEAQALF
ncbi:MAG: hypothetical protein JWP01_2998 [Myxococcales bacterium]|nr:hypothetical protein [Myxococcales bacterium]